MRAMSDNENDTTTEESIMTRYGAIRNGDDTPSENSKAKKKLLKEKLRWKRRTRAEQQVYENNIKDFLDALLSNTSLLAISNIVKRKHPILKTLWTIALVFCLILSIRQVHSLSTTYFSHPKSTRIELSYKPFEFPSVTVCNHNPLRRSSVALFGQDKLKDFASELETRNYSVADNGTQLMTQRRDRLEFHKIISNHSNEDRLSMGYQLSNFVLQCSFGGEECQRDMFSVSLSKTYGNCFTFNGWHSPSSGVLAKNGREHGLIMTLYLELDEYMRSFIPSSGVKLHIHESGSMAFPEYSGFSVPPGYQSSIGLSLKKISRIDRDNDRCDNGATFKEKFKFKYTFSTCVTLCEHLQVSERCKCYDRSTEVFYKDSKRSLKPCQSEEELSCMMHVLYQGEQGGLNCSCLMPCSESHYNFKHSLSEWPADSYETRLFNDLVDLKPTIANLKNETKSLVRRNLLNLMVYVDGLMTEHVIESNSYGLDNYLSDIGGTLGFLIGFSVLTGFELLEAGALILAYLGGKIVYRSDEEETAVGHATSRHRSDSQLMSLSGSTQAIHLR